MLVLVYHIESTIAVKRPFLAMEHPEKSVLTWDGQLVQNDGDVPEDADTSMPKGCTAEEPTCLKVCSV